jgi:general secretion pathway protein A
LLHALLGQLDSSTASAFIFNPKLSPLDFFEMLFQEFGIDRKCKSKAEYLIHFNEYLIERLANNEPTLLIVDEAQNLSPEMLEEIRLLSNLETPTSKLIQIMLVGQPELNEMLARPDLRQLRQRIALRYHLRPFNSKELHQYVGERLAKAGYTGRPLFNRGSLKALYSASGGTPRVINNLCDAALLQAYARDLPTIDGKLIREVVSNLSLDETPAGGEGPREKRGLRKGLRSLFR